LNNLAWVDGKQFLILQPDPRAIPTQINVVLNWFDELKAKVPDCAIQPARLGRGVEWTQANRGGRQSRLFDVCHSHVRVTRTIYSVRRVGAHSSAEEHNLLWDARRPQELIPLPDGRKRHEGALE
jgi:hypothetical protein